MTVDPNVYAAAQQAASQLGIPTEWVIAQWNNEEGPYVQGQYPSSEVQNNLAGLTGSSAYGSWSANGYQYQSFPNLSSFADAYANFLKPYNINTSSPQSFINSLVSQGYTGNTNDTGYINNFLTTLNNLGIDTSQMPNSTNTSSSTTGTSNIPIVGGLINWANGIFSNVINWFKTIAIEILGAIFILIGIYILVNTYKESD